MILGYRDKRTREFAAGKRVKAFESFAHKAEMKLDQLEAATSLEDLAVLPGNRLEALKGDRKGQIQHPYQRAMAYLLPVAARLEGSC